MFTPYAFIKNQKIALSLDDLVLSPVIKSNENYDVNVTNYLSNTFNIVEPSEAILTVIDGIKNEGEDHFNNYEFELENLLRKSNNTDYENTLLKLVEERYDKLNNHIVLCNLNKSIYDVDSPNQTTSRKYDLQKRIDEISKPLPHKVWKPVDQIQSPFQSTNNLGRQRPSPSSINNSTKSRPYSSNSSHASPNNMRYMVHKDNLIYDSNVLLHSHRHHHPNNSHEKTVTISSFNKWLQTRNDKAYSLQSSPNNTTNNTTTPSSSSSSLSNTCDKLNTKNNKDHKGSHEGNKRNMLFKTNREEYYLLDVFERLSLQREWKNKISSPNNNITTNNNNDTRSASPTINKRSRYLADRYRKRSKSCDLSRRALLVLPRSKSLERNNNNNNHVNNSSNHNNNNHLSSSGKESNCTSSTNQRKEVTILKATATTTTTDAVLISTTNISTNTHIYERVIKDIANAKIKSKRNQNSKSRKRNQNMKKSSDGMYHINSSFEERNLKSIESILIRKELARRYPYHPGPNQYNNCQPKDAERILSSPPRRSYININTNNTNNKLTIDSIVITNNTVPSRSPSPGCRGYTFPKDSSDRLDIIRKDLL